MSKVKYWATLKILLFLNLKYNSYVCNNEMEIQVLWNEERCFSKYNSCVKKLQVLPLFCDPWMTSALFVLNLIVVIDPSEDDKILYC